MRDRSRHTWWLIPLALLALLVAACVSAPSTTPALLPEPLQSVAIPSIAPATVEGAAAKAETLALADQLRLRAPQPRRIVSTEGRLPGDPLRAESNAAQQEWYGMLALAQAARLTGDRGYGDALERYFAAWAPVFEPQGNPISETHFQQLILAFETGEDLLTPATHTLTLRLFQRTADVVFDRKRIRQGTDRNNWQSHRIKLGTALAFVLDDRERIAISRGVFQQHIANTLSPDGTVLDFRERDALHYVVYSLEPLLTAALIARQHGEDWYSFTTPEGASLARALQWLLPYATGERTHVEFQNTRIEFDRARARAGVPGYSGLWQPAEAATCYQLAARLDARWIDPALRLGPAPAWVELAYASPLLDAARVVPR